MEHSYLVLSAGNAIQPPAISPRHRERSRVSLQRMTLPEPLRPVTVKNGGIFNEAPCLLIFRGLNNNFGLGPLRPVHGVDADCPAGNHFSGFWDEQSALAQHGCKERCEIALLRKGRDERQALLFPVGVFSCGVSSCPVERPGFEGCHFLGTQRVDMIVLGLE
jgi:hypothetical protein